MRFKIHIFIFFITSILYASAIAQENNTEPKKNSLKIKFLELFLPILTCKSFDVNKCEKIII